MKIERFGDPLAKKGYPEKPSIAVAVGYDDRGKINKIGYVPFEPGRIIERCGRKYRLEKNGSQTRII